MPVPNYWPFSVQILIKLSYDNFFYRNARVTKLWSHDHIYKRPRVANFADIIKIATTFLKITLKDSKKFKELEIMYKNVKYIYFFI